MKKLNIIYNHNIFDGPYKQSEVRKTENAIKSQFGDDVQIVVTHSNFHSPNSFVRDDELIKAEHSFDMTEEEKKSLALTLCKSVTRLKSCDPVVVVVSFRKIEEDDLWVFEP